MKKHIEYLRCSSRFLPVLHGWLILLAAWLLLTGFAGAQTWTLSWSDEFNGPANSPIDSTRWQFDTGILNVNNEVEYYCSPGSSTSPCDPLNPNAYIDGNGNLVIQALRINSGTAPYSGSWTSARLNTANNLANFNYGRIESNMQLPTGPGLWPAFWALGTDIGSVSWPACGETDYMENVPASGGLGPGVIKSTIHGPGYSGANGLGETYSFPNGEQVSDPSFHTYGTIWSANQIQFYVDDPSNVFFIRTASDIPPGDAWPFNANFFLLLNLAVGGTGSWPGPPDSTTPSPAVMRVNYVRAYSSSTVAGPTMTGTPISVTAGVTTGNSSPLTFTLTPGTGFVYFSCTTTAPKASCAITTNDPLDKYVANSNASPADTVTVSVTTTANTSASSTTTARSIPPPFFFNPKTRILLPITVMGFLVSVVVAPVVHRRRSIGLYVCALAAALILTGATWSCGGGSSSSTPVIPPSNNGTTPGSYTVTVYAFTESNSSNGANSNADANVAIPLTVN